LSGTYTVEIVQTYFNSGWGRYTFYQWWDGSTSNPRSFTVSGDITLTAYVYDERLLKVTYTSGGYVKVNGQQVSSGWTGWYRYGTSVTLEAVPSSSYVLQKWMHAVNGGSLTDYSVRLKEAVSGSASSAHYARVDKTTSNAFTGYVEISMTFSASGSGYAYFTWYASIYTPSRTLASDWGDAPVSNRVLTWNGTLNNEKVTFTVYDITLLSGVTVSVCAYRFIADASDSRILYAEIPVEAKFRAAALAGAGSSFALAAACALKLMRTKQSRDSRKSK